MKNKKILINSMTGIINKIVLVLLGFWSRKIFIIYLGTELSGLISLFTNIMELLSLATLGIGGAIDYKLFQYVSTNDEKRIAALIQYSKRVYFKIACIMNLGAVLILPFIQSFIKDNPFDLTFVRIIFILQVFSGSLQYCFAYKKAFLQVKEELYLINVIDMLFGGLFTVLRINVVIQFRNYYMYIILTVIQVLITNIITNKICDKRYPFIETYKNVLFDCKKDIRTKLKDLSIVKISEFIYSFTDNIIISTFLGLKYVNLYANYYMIINYVSIFVNQINESVKYAIGNLIHTEIGRHEIYKKMQLNLRSQFVISTNCTLMLYFLLDLFIELWLGNKYILNTLILQLFCIDFWLKTMYAPLNNFLLVIGAFKVNKYIRFITAIFNLLASLFLVKNYNIAGILFATLVGDLATLVLESIYIYHIYFTKKMRQFLKNIIFYACLCISEGILINYIRSIFIIKQIYISFIFNFLISLIIPALFNITIFTIIIKLGREGSNQNDTIFKE